MNSSGRLLQAKNNSLVVQQHPRDNELIKSPSTCKEKLAGGLITSLRQWTDQVAFYMQETILLWCSNILVIINSSNRLPHASNNFLEEQ